MKKDGGCRGKTTVHCKKSNIFRLTIVAVFLVLASFILIVSTVSDSDNLDAATGGNTFTLKANYEGGADTTAMVEYGDTAFRTFTGVLCPGQTLEGYYLDIYLTKKVLNADGTFVFGVTGYIDSFGKWVRTADATFYAKWNDTQSPLQTVKLKANYESAEASADTTATIKYGDNAFRTFTGVLNSGKTLVGYYLDANFTKQVLNADGTFFSKVSGYIDDAGKWVRTADAILYAKWDDTQSPLQTVTLKANYEGGAYTTATVKYGDTALKTFTEVLRPGQTLKGYYLEVTCTTQVLNADGTFVSGVSRYVDNAGKWVGPDNATFYAKWGVGSYTVKFDANGGLVGPTSKVVRYGETYGDLPTPTKAGDIFDGWYCIGKKITASSIVTETRNHTLVASWISTPAPSIGHEVKVTFDSAGGSSVDSISVKYGFAYKYLPSSDRDNYAFDGWYLDGMKITSTSVVDTYNDHTLTAKWSELPYDVDASADGQDTDFLMISVIVGLFAMTLAPIAVYIRRKN